MVREPKNRSGLRVIFGKLVYSALRFVCWYSGGKRYAVGRADCMFHNCILEHRTPLVRKLKDLDMWMQYNKICNLSIAAKQLNGIVLRPGETFSYWKLIGHPSRLKGYKTGMILHNGRVSSGMGGGLCQLSNLIYWMTLHTSLTVTERYRHSYDVFPDADRNQPFGSGATCVYNYRDLQVYNGTGRSYQLIVYLTDQQLVGQWRSNETQGERYQVHERNHGMRSTYWGGYIRYNELYRSVYNMAGELVRDEFITKNEALMMYNPFIEAHSLCADSFEKV